MQKPIRIERTEDSVDLFIVWSIINLCNYTCSYCPDFNSNGSEKWLDLDKAKKIVDIIHDHYVLKLNHKKVLISFSGGEPLLFKGFPDLIQHIRQKGMHAGITSNGSCGIKLWEKLFHEMEFICISYHPEFANDEKIIELVKEMAKHSDVAVPALRIMAPAKKELYNKAIKFYEKIIQLEPHAYEFVKIQNDFGIGIEESHYTEEQEEFLKNHGFTEHIKDKNNHRNSPHYLDHIVEYRDGHREKLRANELVNKDLINFKGWKCFAGIESLYIDAAGNLYESGCKLNGIISNLKDLDNVQFPSNPVTCTLERCICQSDIMISKFED